MWSDERQFGFAMVQVRAGLSATQAGSTVKAAMLPLNAAPLAPKLSAQSTAALTAKAVQILNATY